MSRRIVITSGPTREWVDPIRFVSNPSSGKVGLALARAARKRGHQVTLIIGASVRPTRISGVESIRVETVEDMLEACRRVVGEADILIMAAAPGDFRPVQRQSQKIKTLARMNRIRWRRNPDILKILGRTKKSGQVFIGFALETEDVLEGARRKLRSKLLDAIVANTPASFADDRITTTVLLTDGREYSWPNLLKTTFADQLIRLTESL